MTEIVERVDQRRLVEPAGHQRLGLRRAPDSVSANALAATGQQRPGPPVERDQVARADPPARPGQQPQQRRAGERVGEHLAAC